MDNRAAQGPSKFARYSGEVAGNRTREEQGRYIASPQLKLAVNTALALGQPLFITGEPGAGKTTVAWSVAAELGLGPPLLFSTRSDHTSRDLLYSFDHLRRLYDANLAARSDGTGAGGGALDPESYLEYQALGRAIVEASSAPQASALRERWRKEDTNKRDAYIPLAAGEDPALPRQRMVVIDEIDKAPRDFPNDLLNEIEQMEFTVRESNKSFRAEPGLRPVVFITSNSERQMPDAFMRRCVFHYIELPREDTERKKWLAEILRQRLKRQFDENPRLLDCLEDALTIFLRLSAHPQLNKRPGVAELLGWIQLLVAKYRREGSPEHLREELQRVLRSGRYGNVEDLANVLIKNWADLQLLKG